MELSDIKNSIPQDVFRKKSVPQRSQEQTSLFPLKPRFCKCGCGFSLEGRRKNVKYFNAQHRSKAARNRKDIEFETKQEERIKSASEYNNKHPDFKKQMIDVFVLFFMQNNRYPSFAYCWYRTAEEKGFHPDKNWMRWFRERIQKEIPKTRIWRTRQRSNE